MPNVPHGKKAEKGKYEGRPYLHYEEAADYLGIRRSTLYNYIAVLKIKRHKFKLDKKRYIAIADVKQIEKIIEEPWLAGAEEEEEPEPIAQAA